LNSRDGGVIYLGVDNQDNVGADDLDGLQLIVKNRIRQNIMPSTMGLFAVCTSPFEKGGTRGISSLKTSPTLPPLFQRGKKSICGLSGQHFGLGVEFMKCNKVRSR